MAWAYPIQAISADETKLDETQFINYEQFHKTPQMGTAAKSLRTSSGSVVSGNKVYSGRHYSKEEVQDLIRAYSEQYRIDSSTPLCIASKESGFNQFSANRSSSARGVFQYLSGTWASTDEGKSGLSVFDARANVLAAVKYMAIHKNTRPWVVAPSCPSLKFL
jgi:hypothetical protein